MPPDEIRIAHLRPSSATDARACAWCLGSMDGRRSQARTCGKSCRQALSRFESGGAIAARDASPRRRTVRARAAALAPIAALFVQSDGAYYELPGVDPWDQARDARRYAGPHPVIAHPPCGRWCRLAGFVEKRFGYRRGEDGGCFAAALASVRRWGGVLEHPAYSAAFPTYGLPKPSRFGGWLAEPDGPGFVCQVEQGRYGHPAKKATWLYVCGLERLPDLRWGYEPDGDSDRLVSWCGNARQLPEGVERERDERPRIRAELSSRTVPEFRAALLSLARLVRPGRDDASTAAHDASPAPRDTSGPDRATFSIAGGRDIGHDTGGAILAPRDISSGVLRDIGAGSCATSGPDEAPETMLERCRAAGPKVSRSVSGRLRARA